MVKVLAIGQTPPPYRGGQIVLEFLVRSQLQGVEMQHMRIELSSDESQAGKFRLMKLFRLLGFILRMIYARFRARPQILYYVPSLEPRSTLIRDTVILGCTRALFPHTILHFHAGGYAEFYERLSPWKQWFFRRAFFGAEATIRLSELTPEDGRGLHSQREFIVPNGIVDMGASLALPRPEFAVSAVRPLRILFVALLSEAKGLLDLIEGCGKLAARGISFQLALMGSFDGEEFAARVKTRISELGIGKQVACLGVLSGDDKLAAFRDADVLCHPTFNDTFGIVIVEAMSCGMPVVATRWCSIPLIVHDGVTGLLVEPHDPDGVANALEQLANDPELVYTMGIAGREKFLREYTLARHCDQMREVFLEVAGEPSGELVATGECAAAEFRELEPRSV
jgi:glycosyltransferase involved in cell wall biosynthesis